MKANLIMTLILFLIMIFIPLITLTDGEKEDKLTTSEQIKKETTVSATAENTTLQETVTLTVSATGKITEMSVQDYVYGAVCAEMPASFHKEALKAQAVASYTYMKWLKENADNPSDISDNPSVHQAFLTEDELKEKWGNSYSIYSQKVREAVESVLYEYITYNGKTAMTVFHGLSPGKTSDACEIWKNDVPYLKSAPAPGDKLSPDITTEVKLNTEEFLKPFSAAENTDIEALLKNVKKNDDGFISEISYGNKTLSKTDLRSAYSLKSPYFTLEKTKDGISLTVYGKGHGVGMSQYSADYMARQGSSYKEILLHFYKNTKLVTNKNNVYK